MISIIAAIGKNRELGKDNKLIWHMPSDLKFFKETTMNHPVIMGKNTYKSIGKPLPGRTNIVLNDTNEHLEGEIITCSSLEEALKICQNKEVFIIGGAYLYKCAIDLADKIFLTEINHEFDADVFFPDFNKQAYERIIIDSGVDNNLEYSHVLYRRKK